MMLRFLGENGFDLVASGTKATQLHRLAEGGFPVPPGFVVPHDSGAAELTDERLSAAIERIGGFPVAVRSSGNLEDLAGASFAGQYVSILDVSGLGELRSALARCRASADSDQVKAYLAKNGLSAEKNRLAVLVQKMVPARLAGVAFTIHPLTGREEHALVECCEGLGEKLVSGRVAPTQYVLKLEDGSTVEHVPGDEGAALPEGARVELARKLLEIQAFFGTPQDVEWALDAGNRLWILQSRPITRIEWRSDVDEYTNADFKDGGVSARVCTPLMYSLYREALQRSMPEYFERIRLIRAGEGAKQEWIRSFYGRVYWNASAVKRCLFRVPGFSEKAFDEDLGIQKNYGSSGPVLVPTNPRTILGAIPVAFALEKEYKRGLERASGFGGEFAPAEGRFLAGIARFEETSDGDFRRDLVEVLTRFFVETEAAYFTTIYNNANFQSDFKSFLRKMDAATGGETSLIRLMAGLADVSHMNLQRGLLRLCEVARAEGFQSEAWNEGLKDFLRENYFHGDAELELRTPRWGEAPERVREMVTGMIRSGSRPADPDETILKQKREYESELASVRGRLGRSPWARFRFASAFERHLGRMRAYLSRREEMREYSTRCYFIVRQYALESGRRFSAAGWIDAADDVFMLHLSEIVDLAEGRLEAAEARARVGYRRHMYEGYRQLTPPNELGRGVRQREEETFSEQVDGRRVLKGLGCSPGVVEGSVRVIHSLEEIGEIQQGEILVTRFTDPGWTPALGLVRGIVTEVGGLLSHAAVIGREYGIPAVLNLPGATRALATGQRVRVDGASGRVEVLDA